MSVVSIGAMLGMVALCTMSHYEVLVEENIPDIVSGIARVEIPQL